MTEYIMRKILTLFSWSFFLGSFFIIHSCSYLKELSALKECEFRVGTMENPLLAGVDISKIVTIKDYSIDQTTKITRSILQGKLPLSFILNIEVKNPNKKNASLNRLEYLAYIDDVQVAAGATEEHVVIPPDGGVANIPLKVETDIFDLLKKEPVNTLLNYTLNLVDDGDRPVRVSIKIKPWIQVGNRDHEYPGYLTINQDFSTGK
jgi:LEA14-like dessication related protein